MAKQTKIGLALIFFIVGVAGYAAYYKIGPKDWRVFGISLNRFSGRDDGLEQAPPDQVLRPTGAAEEPFAQNADSFDHHRHHEHESRKPAFGDDLFEAQHEPPVPNDDPSNEPWGSGNRRHFDHSRSPSGIERQRAFTENSGGTTHPTSELQSPVVGANRFGPDRSLANAPQTTPIGTRAQQSATGTPGGGDPFGRGNFGDGRQPSGQRSFGGSASSPGVNPVQSSDRSKEPDWGTSFSLDDARAGSPQPIRQTALKDPTPGDSRQGRTFHQGSANADDISNRTDPFAQTVRTDAPAPSPAQEAQNQNRFGDRRFGDSRFGGNRFDGAGNSAVRESPAGQFENQHTYRDTALPEGRRATAPGELPGSHIGSKGHRDYRLPYGKAPPPGDGADTYVVQRNDTFWSISNDRYGTPLYYRALARINEAQVADPLTMRPGTRIAIPSLFILRSRFPDLVPKDADPRDGVAHAGTTAVMPAGFFRDANRSPNYRVGKDDTLSGIAQKHLGGSARWIQIYALNRDVLQNPNSLKIGTVLRLPPDARAVRVANQAGEFR